MKNLFKFGFLALAITLSVAACNSEGSGSAKDTVGTDMSVNSDTTIKNDTTMIDTVVTTDTTVVKN